MSTIPYRQQSKLSEVQFLIDDIISVARLQKEDELDWAKTKPYTRERELVSNSLAHRRRTLSRYRDRINDIILE